MNKHYELYIEKIEELKPLLDGRPEEFEETFNKHNDFIKQTFIDIADREIERLGKENIHDPVWLKEDENVDTHTLQNRAFNVAMEDQISYWNKAKELITNHK